MFKRFDKLRTVVAHLGLAGSADGTEVFSDLNVAVAQSGCNGGCGNIDLIFGELLEIVQVYRKSSERTD